MNWWNSRGDKQCKGIADATVLGRKHEVKGPLITDAH